ncbi:hypothetical protein [Roseateles amylovorans]|uniref:Uncharacterized protein n=1 Tax=Roseateles amylovorans TaxID=2978473 RepID=A0ABY6B0U4_9BURK|nr:hypothetical protein [Roseateles amylovorans]UXH77811.1 hypothetical protein N4261_23010 [Roseateles amylovorans]
MRFDKQAFKASVQPISADESRANLAALVAPCEGDVRFVTVECEFDEEVSELSSRATQRAGDPRMCA